MSTTASPVPTAEAAAVAGQPGLHTSRRTVVLALSGVTALTEVAGIAGVLPHIRARRRQRHRIVGGKVGKGVVGHARRGVDRGYVDGGDMH